MAFQFPVDINQQLLGVDYRLLDALGFLAKQQRKKSGAAYCMPGRKYLSQKLGVSIRTVSRSIARLKRLGILDVIQRRPVRGIWKTNLYKIRSWVGWRLGQIAGMLRKVTHREPHVAHIAPRERVIRTADAYLPLQKATSDPSEPAWNAKGEALLADWQKRGIISS